MMNILRVLFTLAGEQKLKLSMTRIEHLMAQLIAVLIIGMFLTTLGAVAVVAGLFGLYQSLITSGYSATSALLALGFALVLILGFGMVLLLNYMKSIREGLKAVARIETPIVGPVVRPVSNVAQSFISGLLHPHGSKKAALATTSQPRSL